MREILFRGKSMQIENKNQFIYGGIVHQTDFYGNKCDKYFIIDGTDTQDYDIGYEYQVFPETVGQYTGLKDKNGKKIFEGDIVKYTVKLAYAGLEDYSEILRVGIHDAGWSIFNKGGYVSLAKALKLDYVDVEVIGNIYDNQELLPSSVK